jgi:peptidoglycan hydrolase CwlO-like protein
MTLTITIDQNKPCAKCGAKGATQNGLCLTCISKKIKEQKKGGIMATKGQQNLFGDQDLVINTLETERSGLQKEIEATQKAIESKQDKLDELEGRVHNITLSLESIRKAVKTEKKKEAV